MKSVHKGNEQCFGSGFVSFEDNADPDPGWFPRILKLLCLFLNSLNQLLTPFHKIRIYGSVSGDHKLRLRSRSRRNEGVALAPGELIAAGASETETQDWIRSIRSRIWKPGHSKSGNLYKCTLI